MAGEWQEIPEQEMAEQDQWQEAPDASRFLPQTLNVAGFDTGVEIPQQVAAGLVGAGKSFMDLYQGGRDLLGMDVTSDASDEAAYNNLSDQFGAATFVGELAPYMAASFAAPATIAGQGLLAGGLGFTRQQGDLTERLRQGGIEGSLGAGGAALGNMAGRIINRVRGVQNRMPNAAQELAERGGQVTPGQATGSNILQTAEAPMQSMGMLGKMQEANQEIIQKTTARSIGNMDGDLTARGLGNAADRISRDFGAALEGVKLDVPDPVIEKLGKIKRFDKFIELPETMANMSGNQYKKMRSTLSKAMSSAYRSQDETKGDFIAGTIKQLDNAFMRKAGPGRAKDFAKAREQWKNLLTIEKGQAVTPDGYVNPTSLNNAYNNMWGKTARRGDTSKVLPETGDAMDMARLQASRELKPVVGDSGTATRAGAGFGPEIVGAGAGGLLGGDIESVMLGAGLGAGDRYGYLPLGKALSSPTVPGLQEAFQALLAEQGR